MGDSNRVARLGKRIGIFDARLKAVIGEVCEEEEQHR
jgi:hypothetical protein